MKRLKNKNVIMVSKLCKLIKNQLIAYLQVVHFMAYKLHFNKAIYKKEKKTNNIFTWFWTGSFDISLQYKLSFC